MFIYILSFFIILLIGLYINKLSEDNENKKNNKDYKLQFLVYSSITILLIIYFQLLFSDIFIDFLKQYTSIGYKLESFKNYLFSSSPKNIEKPINLIGGGNHLDKQLKIRDFIVNNDLPLSDSDISSIDFN